MKKILNFIKKILLLIINFILSFFSKKDIKKEDKKDKKLEKKEDTHLKYEKTSFKLPDESQSKQNPEFIIEKKEEKKEEQFEYSDRNIEEIIEKVIEKKYDLKIKNFTKEEKEYLKKYHEKAVLVIKKDLGKINSKEELKEICEKKVYNYLEKNPYIEEKKENLDEVKINKQDDKLQDIKKPKAEKKNNLEINKEQDNNETREEFSNIIKEKVIKSVEVASVLLIDLVDEITKNNNSKQEDNIITQEEFIDDNIIDEQIKTILEIPNLDPNYEINEYEMYQENIDKVLYDLTLFDIQYEKKLTPKQKNDIAKEKQKLELLKEEIKNKEQENINEEKDVLNETIPDNEKKNVKDYIITNNDDRVELMMEGLNQNEDLDKINILEQQKIEKKLIKKKIKRAEKIAAFSIIGLPFIKNKYFKLYIHTNLLNKNLREIECLLNHETLNYDMKEIDEIIDGRSALESSMFKTYDNLLLLESIEKKINIRHPSLMKDYEYLKSSINVRNKLNSTYKRIMMKNPLLEKIFNKKYQKILKKEKYL